MDAITTAAHYQNHRWREDENELVFSWRMEQLLRADYPVPVAERLAGAVHVDLHLAVELVRVRGCSPDLASRVLL